MFHLYAGTSKRTYACSGHYIRSKVLRELLLETIRAASTFAISDRAKQFLELARTYTDFSELTTPMINEFVEKPSFSFR